MEAFRLIGCSGWGRLDLILRADGDMEVPRGEHVSRHDRRTAWCRWRRGRPAWTFPTFASRSCEAPMWDNPRQLNAIALALALAARRDAFGWGARRVGRATAGVRVSPRRDRRDARRRSIRRTSKAVIREELTGTFFTMQLADARASLQRVPWVRERRAAPAVAGSARGDGRRARAARALERQRAGRHRRRGVHRRLRRRAAAIHRTRGDRGGNDARASRNSARRSAAPASRSRELRLSAARRLAAEDRRRARR